MSFLERENAAFIAPPSYVRRKCNTSAPVYLVSLSPDRTATVYRFNNSNNPRPLRSQPRFPTLQVEPTRLTLRISILPPAKTADLSFPGPAATSGT